ncbi:M23 family metallopeptidase [Novosphingobium sp. 1949]|uniref:M23 family metallopeptidase n=1 Tax=Novosphingobium organovorum TaxID=2930092 RepID=A0ABT0BEX9_9SPHN|nr:M23 family metallopeptidase [Novosphingobium organovorum]MCJ2183621.1 M23 family metallopeptidase [Novosphingobium organovorum]
MRSQGHVHFIRISSRAQMIAAGAVVALTLGWLGSMGTMAFLRLHDAAQHAALLDREAQVAKAEDRVENYRDHIHEVESDLAQRQKFIERTVKAYIGDLPRTARSGETVSDSDAEADKTIKKVSLAVPEASGLARLEARQLTFVEGLTRYADRRSEDVATKLRKLGLNPRAMMGSAIGSGREAQGGPLDRLSTGSDGSLDPRFARLGASLARLDALENGLASLPQIAPTRTSRISSTFGFRRDPFTGGGAFHAGIDFPAPIGTPIFAAAQGRVTYAGPRSGYGNCVEIDHGNGLVTRYGHLSKWSVRVGEKVTTGERIAAMGSTGRSTGSHLHFEVRVNGQAVNPRPFLEAVAHVHEEG